MPYLSLLPSHINLVGSEIELVGFEDRERILTTAIAPLRTSLNSSLSTARPPSAF